MLLLHIFCTTHMMRRIINVQRSVITFDTYILSVSRQMCQLYHVCTKLTECFHKVCKCSTCLDILQTSQHLNNGPHTQTQHHKQLKCTYNVCYPWRRTNKPKKLSIYSRFEVVITDSHIVHTLTCFCHKYSVFHVGYCQSSVASFCQLLPSVDCLSPFGRRASSAARPMASNSLPS